MLQVLACEVRITSVRSPPATARNCTHGSGVAVPEPVHSPASTPSRTTETVFVSVPDGIADASMVIVS